MIQVDSNILLLKTELRQAHNEQFFSTCILPTTKEVSKGELQRDVFEKHPLSKSRAFKGDQLIRSYSVDKYSGSFFLRKLVPLQFLNKAEII